MRKMPTQHRGNSSKLYIGVILTPSTHARTHVQINAIKQQFAGTVCVVVWALKKK